MQITLRKSRDLITPSLRRLARGVGGATKLHRAMGEVVVQTAKKAFNDPAERARAWKPLWPTGAPRASAQEKCQTYNGCGKLKSLATSRNRAMFRISEREIYEKCSLAPDASWAILRNRSYEHFSIRLFR